MILVDTSVWVDHLRSRVALLQSVLDQGLVLMHPIVIGELACSHLRNRTGVIGMMRELANAPVADHGEVLDYIERRRLMGRGLGYNDVQLLASAVLAGARLWTRDRRLKVAAEEVEVSYSDPPP